MHNAKPAQYHDEGGTMDQTKPEYTNESTNAAPQRSTANVPDPAASSTDDDASTDETQKSFADAEAAPRTEFDRPVTGDNSAA
jgi:hypothetical protein